MAKNSLKAIPLTTFDSATLLATYQPLNPNGLPFACLVLKIQNAATTAITLSYDDSTDHDFVSAGSIITLSSNAISSQTPDTVKIQKGTIVYAKGIAGVGTIYVIGYYLEQ